MKKMNSNGVFISEQDVIRVSKNYKIVKIEVFGSVLRADFNSDSDIDLLVTFKKDADISLFDLMDLESEFTSLFNRSVDIVEPDALKNPLRRKNILTSCELFFAA